MKRARGLKAFLITDFNFPGTSGKRETAAESRKSELHKPDSLNYLSRLSLSLNIHVEQTTIGKAFFALFHHRKTLISKTDFAVKGVFYFADHKNLTNSLRSSGPS